MKYPQCNIYKCDIEADYYFHWFTFDGNDEQYAIIEREGFICLKHLGRFLDSLTNINYVFWYEEIPKRERIMLT
jgi:hypothetical protein